MKKIISTFSALLLVGMALFSGLFPTLVVAAPAERLEIEAPKTAKVGESVDITVKAVAKDGSVDKDYSSNVFIFVDKDTKAVVPGGDDGYTFTASDAGSKTFSKGLSFTKEGKMIVTVVDSVNTTILGTYVVEVGPGGSNTNPNPTLTEKISIISPESGTILSKDSIEVVGTTKKNSKVQVFLNNQLSMTVTTDEQGQFLGSIKDITQTENTLQVKVLDGSDQIVGESVKIMVKKADDTGSIKNFTFAGGNTVAAKSNIAASFEAQPKLSEVKVTVGDFVETFVESKTKEGLYEGKIVAPSASGSYSVSVLIKTDLGKTNNIPKAATLKVVEGLATGSGGAAKIENISMVQSGSRVTFNFDISTEVSNLSKFKILYGTGKDTLSTERLTYEVSKIKTASGYSWYIDGLTPTTYFFQLVGLDDQNKAIPNLISTVQEFPMALNAAGAQTCIVGDVGGVSVMTQKGISIISWKQVANASGYKIYKMNAKGELEAIAETKEPMYKLYITPGAIKFEDFGIKAICGDKKVLSPGMAMATKVQTGPGALMAIILLSLGLGYWYMRRTRFQ